MGADEGQDGTCSSVPTTSSAQSDSASGLHHDVIWTSGSEAIP